MLLLLESRFDNTMCDYDFARYTKQNNQPKSNQKAPSK